jgi:hypothetical protein
MSNPDVPEKEKAPSPGACSDLLACPFCGLTDKDSVSPDMGYVPAVALNADLRHSADSAASQSKETTNEK